MKLSTGIRKEVIFLILAIPPIIIIKDTKENANPKRIEEMGRRADTELTCTKFPVVKEFITQKRATAQERK